jgi:hypothetical protein
MSSVTTLSVKDEVKDPTFGEADSIHTLIDQEMVSRAPILTSGALFANTNDALEFFGPFMLTFLTDSKKVWAILHTLFGTTSM